MKIVNLKCMEISETVKMNAIDGTTFMVERSEVYGALAKMLGITETDIPNIWHDERGYRCVLTKYGFRFESCSNH